MAVNPYLIRVKRFTLSFIKVYNIVMRTLNHSRNMYASIESNDRLRGDNYAKRHGSHIGVYMQSKFPGKCHICYKPINVKDFIIYNASAIAGKKVAHSFCQDSVDLKK